MVSLGVLATAVALAAVPQGDLLHNQAARRSPSPAGS